MNKIEIKFRNKAAIDRGTYLLFTKEVSLEFIKECHHEKTQILGIDGFFLRDKGIQPSLEHSVDFSELELEEAYQRSLEFLNQQPEELFFEVVCSED
ncbi:MAG: hypothetical protein H7A32_01465 [Deltaproteobacteria bacterium]|nr:hypothetical protein [Deltaproteobacteria bacterium]